MKGRFPKQGPAPQQQQEYPIDRAIFAHYHLGFHPFRKKRFLTFFPTFSEIRRDADCIHELLCPTGVQDSSSLCMPQVTISPRPFPYKVVTQGEDANRMVFSVKADHPCRTRRHSWVNGRPCHILLNCLCFWSDKAVVDVPLLDVEVKPRVGSGTAGLTNRLIAEASLAFSGLSVSPPSGISFYRLEKGVDSSSRRSKIGIDGRWRWESCLSSFFFYVRAIPRSCRSLFDVYRRSSATFQE